MPRPKRKGVEKGKQHDADGSILGEGDQHVKASANEVVQDAPVTPSKRDLQKQKHDANVAFWQSLGHDSSRQSLKQSSTSKCLKRKRNLGEIEEKYRLQTHQSSKRVLLLQYPDRGLRDPSKGQIPFSIRMKPKTGVVEVDLALQADPSYNKARGVEYGSALRHSEATRRNGAYGLAGGLNVGATKAFLKDDKEVIHGPSRAELLENVEESFSQGHALKKATLGGRIVPFRHGYPVYMVATFVGSMNYASTSQETPLTSSKQLARGQN